MFFQRSIVEIYGVSFVVFSCYFFSVAVSVLFRYKTKTIVTGYFDIACVIEVNTSRICRKCKAIAFSTGTNIAIVWKYGSLRNSSDIRIFPFLSVQGIGKFKYRIICTNIASRNGCHKCNILKRTCGRICNSQNTGALFLRGYGNVSCLHIISCTLQKFIICCHFCLAVFIDLHFRKRNIASFRRIHRCLCR